MDIATSAEAPTTNKLDAVAAHRRRRSSATLILFLASVLVLAISSLITINVLRTLFNDVQNVREALTMIARIQTAYGTLSDAETGQRGYLLTREPAYLEPYRASLRQIDQDLNAIIEAGRDEPGMGHRLATLDALMRERMAELRRTITILEADGLAAATAHVRVNEDHNLMGQIREVVNDLIAAEGTSLERRTQRAEAGRRAAVLAVAAETALAVGLLAASFWMWRRDRRLREIHTAELAQANVELEARVLDRTRDLLKSNDALQQKIDENERTNAKLEQFSRELERSNRELSDFAFVASHDLQEPLRKIRAFGDRLRLDYRDALGEQGSDFLQRMQSAAQRMSDLINDLLTFSRVNTRGRPFEPVALGEVLRGVLEDLEIKIQETSAEIEIGDMAAIDADPLQMRQLLQNLIGNSLKFSRTDEPPRIRVATAPVEPPSEVHAAEYVDIDWVRLTVADNGIGFDEKYLDRIFTPFQRLHDRRAYAGTGIGLAICRRIAERHGGTITATSREGAGTTFCVDLPVHQPKLQEEERQA